MGGGKINVFHIDREDVMRHEEAEKRLKTVEGHVAGIRRMLEQEAYCIDVIRQIQAVQSALNKVGKGVASQPQHQCTVWKTVEWAFLGFDALAPGAMHRTPFGACRKKIVLGPVTRSAGRRTRRS